MLQLNYCALFNTVPYIKLLPVLAPFTVSLLKAFLFKETQLVLRFQHVFIALKLHKLKINRLILGSTLLQIMKPK